LIYAGDFFEINTVPVNIELHYHRTSPHASEYPTIPISIIEHLEPYRPASD
jgi:hypothetical protein